MPTRTLTWTGNKPDQTKLNFPDTFSSMNVAQEDKPCIPIETDNSARTTSPCQSPTQVWRNDETTNISSPPQISPPVQHMDEPINSMTTLQCSSHALATDETTEHVSLLKSHSRFLETGKPSNFLAEKLLSSIVNFTNHV